MLNNVKNMVKQKQEFLEAADIIFTDVNHGGFSDLILLNESAKDDDDENIENEDTVTGNEDGDNDKEDKEGENMDNENKDETNIPDNEEREPDDGNKIDDGDSVNDILGTSADNEEITNSLNNKETPAEGEDGIDGILNVSLDLSSNTIDDVLPIPPENADTAIVDDVLSTRVPSGFGEDGTGTPPANTDPQGLAAGYPMEEDGSNPPSSDSQTEVPSSPSSTQENIKESVDQFLEGISMDGSDTPATKPEETPAADPAPEEGEPAPAEDPESPVTAAVKDKVGEADTPAEPEADENQSSSKEALLKKLGSLTKGLEDAKKAVMDTIR